jgi:hypothetical protein
MDSHFEKVVGLRAPQTALDPSIVSLQPLPNGEPQPLHRWTGRPNAPQIIERMQERAIVRLPQPPFGGEKL